MRFILASAVLCMVSMAPGCRTYPEANWQYQPYGAGSWHVEPTGALRISATGPESGLFARLNLPDQEHAYRIRIKGAPVSGKTILKVTADGRRPIWMPAPNGERSVVVDSGSIELLFYNDAPFTYQVSGIDIEPHHSAWAPVEYGTVAWDPIEGDRLNVKVDAPPGGVSFTAGRSNTPVTRVHLAGRKVDGAPLLRVTAADGQPRWMSAPEGEAAINLAPPLEVLLYSDLPFSYELHELRFDPCPTCLDAAGMRALLMREIPQLDAALADPLAAATLLLDWAANTVDLGWRAADRAASLNGLTAAQVYQDHWIADTTGASCAGFATFFSDVLELFSLPAFTIDIGYPGTSLTHVTTVLVTGQHPQLRFHVLDPTFNGRYVRRDGAVADLSVVLGSADAARFVTAAISRDVVYQQDELSTLAEALGTVGYDHAACFSRGPSVPGLGICKDVPYSLPFLMHSWGGELKQLGIAPAPDLLRRLLQQRVISISGADEVEGQAFRQLMAKAGIPVGAS